MADGVRDWEEFDPSRTFMPPERMNRRRGGEEEEKERELGQAGIRLGTGTERGRRPHRLHPRPAAAAGRAAMADGVRDWEEFDPSRTFMPPERMNRRRGG
eukprot:gene19018-31481_t